MRERERGQKEVEEVVVCLANLIVKEKRQFVETTALVLI
jgi:hypothetical protein